jgi:membrane protease YdiL (CAAX protease family)
VSPSFIVPGIQGIQSGSTVNGGLDFNGNWTFDPWGSPATGQYEGSGGNPGGFLETTLPGTTAEGFWFQAFSVAGSVPFAARISLDIQILGGLGSGELLVAVDPIPGPPTAAGTVASVNFLGPTPWTTLPRMDADAQISEAGTYYLKIAFRPQALVGAATVGFDNIRLNWTTNAAVFLYLPAPLPLVFFVSQDKGLFLSYYALLITVTLVAGAYHAVRERVLIWNAFRAPLRAIGPRLRSRSAWIAVGQTWMAVTFFQVAFILLVTFAGIETPSPILITAANVWVFLFELANAGVYEEVAFRLLLIGVPMAIGSLILRTMEVNRAGGRWNGPGSARRHIAGAWRFLLGGAVRRASGRETLLAAWALLFVSSVLFGLAHAPGWGWWKVLPSFVAGLGFGYLFLRHGLGAAILAHFVNDYAFSLYYMGIGGAAAEVLLSLLFLGLTIAGAGFFLWYALEAWTHFRDLLARLGLLAVRVRPAVVAASPPGSIAPPSPPPPLAAPPPEPPRVDAFAPMATVTPSGGSMAARDPALIPREYVPTYRAPPYGYPPVRFQCPACGWVEARYDAGRFTCTRCGRTA